MTEWGPYNFEYPLLWNTNPIDTSDTIHFKIYGPKGKWKVVATTGMDSVYLNSQQEIVTSIKQKDFSGNIEIKLSYMGKSFTDAFGNRHIANKPYVFYYKRPKQL